MPLIGLEPIRCRHRGILSPLRLPFRHSGIFCLFSLYLGGLEDALDVYRSFVCHSATAAYFVLFCLFLGGLETHWMNIVHSSAIPPQRHIVDFLSSDNENDCSTTDCFCQQLSFDFWALCYFFFFLRSSTVTAEICFKKSASSRLSTRYIVFAPSYGKASENP